MTKFPHRHSLDLNGPDWWFTFKDHAILGAQTRSDLERAGCVFRPCTVPGNFELDLQAAGLIEDPFFGMNIAALRQYESTHVWYGRRFTLTEMPDAGEPWLTFEGIDCFAEIYLNGERIGDADNMLTVHDFDLRDRLRVDENELLVHLRPAVAEAQKYPYPPGAAAFRQSMESLYVRKAPHMYGWDIMPRALSAGLWRPVTLNLRPISRIDFAHMETMDASAGHARLQLRYRAHLPGADFVRDRFEVAVEGICGDSRFTVQDWMIFEAGILNITVHQPRRWWPRGRGEASLYDITVRLLKNGVELDCTTFRHGIRTVALV
ncbi:MAG: sugar-binding domain-containing protein, partial [bacterium]